MGFVLITSTSKQEKQIALAQRNIEMFKHTHAEGGGGFIGFVQSKVIKLCINTCICLLITIAP